MEMQAVIGDNGCPCPGEIGPGVVPEKIGFGIMQLLRLLATNLRSLRTPLDETFIVRSLYLDPKSM